MTSSGTVGRVLGLDIGAVSLSAVELDERGQPLRSFYELHRGETRSALASLLERVDRPSLAGLAVTTSTPSRLSADARYNDQVCLITAGRQLYPEARSILVVGGERLGLARFDESGNYLSFKTNPPCAAGTGSFLDQQASRLNLSNTSELVSLALANRDPPAKIASRCAVFAKTDLVHAQQEGHRLEAICDGLCRGLAKNIVDTLFAGDFTCGPVLVVGGVAKNEAVVAHIKRLLNVDVVVDSVVPHGAAGAAMKLQAEEGSFDASVLRGESSLWSEAEEKKAYEHPPLELRRSRYETPEEVERWEHAGRVVEHSHPLEVEVYHDLEAQVIHPVYLGVDVGSTSTKAVVTDLHARALAGFYTATAGRPLAATQLIFEGITRWIEGESLDLRVVGCGTTGAGRKFVGKIMGADLVLDEITAHSRAAVELHPGVDTVIEIGGQDSKFMTLRDGRVTLSVMNSVCAAGTGSFIEEQAQRLGVPLVEYGERTKGHRSPLASERCTVFMERDLNHHLRQGYSTPEVLAAVLHSVRENYLNKVAVESAIGDHVVFQGATARNEALVAAFEQRLEKPIHVSPLCHLTGALGVALNLRDESCKGSDFRGLSLHRQKMPVRPEVCDLCTNHCKLSVAEVDGDTVAYGFLCGRDYETKKYVHNNRSGFDLFKTRKRAFRDGGGSGARGDFTVGLPAALHLYEDLPLWRRFFRRLGVRVVTSEKYPDGMKDGRLLAGAELCAPLTALHGHVAHLLDRSDLVFLPFYLERKPEEGNNRRQLCYLTQYAPILGAGVKAGRDQGTVLTPLVHSLRNSVLMKVQLARALAPVLPNGASYLDVSAAFDEASRFKADGLSQLREAYLREAPSNGDIHIVLLGRPYTVLSEWMNKNIPQIIESLGIRVFYQDMLSYGADDVTALGPLLEELHWDYAARILEGAEVTATIPGAYPVLVTSFQCSPDSFVIDYFRHILESHQKPYLVLQLDEHDSRLGYETRIEAAVRAFRYHHRSPPDHGPRATLDPPVAVDGAAALDPAPGLETIESGPPGLLLKKAGISSLTGKTLLFPNWDSLSHKLVVAAARKKGLDARLLEPSEATARRALRHNSGQCTPLNIIAQNFMEYVRENDLDPGSSVLWMLSSSIACNVRLYPHHIRTIFEAHGGGFERSGVYVGNLSLQDISPTLAFDTYLAYLFGGFLRKMGCAIRPYEAVAGDTDETIRWGIRHLERTFEADASKEEALAEVVSRLQAIRVEDTGLRPEVAIFGDLYTRDNDCLNQGLVRFIEANGGQVITTPFTSFAKMVARPYYWKWIIEGNYMNVLSTKTLMAALAQLEKKYFRHFGQILQEPEPPLEDSPLEIFSEYNLLLEHTGESMENLLKVFYLTKQHPEVALFVQASPAFCCPAIVTEAMGREIEAKTGVPVVSITYDGTGGAKNDAILPYLEYPRSRGGGILRFPTA